MKAFRQAAAWLLALSVALLSRRAVAWVETRVLADDVRVAIDRTGVAIVEHGIVLRVAGGPLRSFDVALGDVDVEPLADGAASARPGQENDVPIVIAPRPDGVLRVNIESPKGLSRGDFLFHVRYRKNLLRGDHVRHDGAMVRVEWTGAMWRDGLDNAHCTFVVPAGATEPRAPGEDSADGAGAFLSSVKRAGERDEIELVRPHIARGEAVTWWVRVDPKALAEVRDPRLQPAAATSRPPVRAVARASQVGLLIAVLVAFSVLLGMKAQQVREQASLVARPRPLVPMPAAARVLLGGPCLAAGVALQLVVDDARWGTLLVGFAMSLAAYRRPAWIRAPRGPGRWLPLADGEGFGTAGRGASTWLDASTLSGAVAFALSLACCGALGYVVARTSSYGAYLVLFDSAVLFPLFGTGLSRDLPPHPLCGPGPLLGRIARRVRKEPDVRVMAWARLPRGSDTFDELRLLCMPRIPRRGLTGIEIGLLPVSGAGGRIDFPEVFVRAIEASPCHQAFVELLPGRQWLRGRRPDERVALVRPALPTFEMTVALLGRLLSHGAEQSDKDSADPVGAGRAERGADRASYGDVASSRAATSANAGNTDARSGGSGERTANGAIRSSPVQAT